MLDVDFVCTECSRLLGGLPANASKAECECFHRSLVEQGFTPVHHFGWFCSRGCGEAFFTRQAEWNKAHHAKGS